MNPPRDLADANNSSCIALGCGSICALFLVMAIFTASQRDQIVSWGLGAAIFLGFWRWASHRARALTAEDERHSRAIAEAARARRAAITEQIATWIESPPVWQGPGVLPVQDIRPTTVNVGGFDVPTSPVGGTLNKAEDGLVIHTDEVELMGTGWATTTTGAAVAPVGGVMIGHARSQTTSVSQRQDVGALILSAFRTAFFGRETTVTIPLSDIVSVVAEGDRLSIGVAGRDGHYTFRMADPQLWADAIPLAKELGERLRGLGDREAIRPEGV